MRWTRPILPRGAWPRRRLLSSSRKLRSAQWFDNPANPGMTALYLERYLNFGLTREELQSGRPLIGIAQTGSDLSPCNRIHVELASRVREAWEPPKVRKQRVGLSKRGKATRKEDKRRRGAVKKSRSDSRRGNFD